jgi:hypothetical protein
MKPKKNRLVCLLLLLFSAALVSCSSFPQAGRPAKASAGQSEPSLAAPRLASPSQAAPTRAEDAPTDSPNVPGEATPIDPPTAAPTSALVSAAGTATVSLPPSPAATFLTTGTPDTRKLPKYWAEWPLVPLVSAHAKEIYLVGQAMGNDPHSFSTIGDCQSVPSVFMGIYDTDEYLLGKGYEYLDDTVKQFQGSFNHDSISVKDGMSVASVLSPMWADPKQCQQGETPLDCELRLHKPVIMFINLGTNWNGGDEVSHEKYMRQIVDILIAHGVIPIISSKGDNQEGGQRINQSMARVAYTYDIPFWNFWLSIRDLPGKGLDGTREGGYLTPAAWGRRSFTGLMALDAVWREVNK